MAKLKTASGEVLAANGAEDYAVRPDLYGEAVNTVIGHTTQIKTPGLLAFAVNTVIGHTTQIGDAVFSFTAEAVNTVIGHTVGFQDSIIEPQWIQAMVKMLTPSAHVASPEFPSAMVSILTPSAQVQILGHIPQG